MSGFRTTFRRIIGRMAAPVWRPIRLRIENRLAPLEQRLGRLEVLDAQVAALEALAQRLAAAATPDLSESLEQVRRHVDSVADAVTGWGNRVIAVEAGQGPLAPRVEAVERAWRQHIPVFLNGVGTVAALAHALTDQRGRLDGMAGKLETYGQRLDNNDTSNTALWNRIEFARREILFEMVHGPARNGTSQEPVPARINAPQRLESMRAEGRLRLNLGAGHIARPDYLNVDRRDLPGIDIVAEADDLPLEPGTVDEIASAHLLEHVPQEALIRRYLPHWLSLLRPGGTFRAVTPDAAAMLAAAAGGTYPFVEFREALFGGQDYDGDFHHNIFTPDSLADLLRDAGLTGITVPVAGRRNGKCFEFEITAIRP